MWHRAREMPPKQRHGSPCRPRRAESPRTRSSGRPRPASTVQTPVSARLERRFPRGLKRNRPAPVRPAPSRGSRAASRGRASPPTGLGLPSQKRQATPCTAQRTGGRGFRAPSRPRPPTDACLLRERAQPPEAAPRCQIITSETAGEW